MKKLLIIIGSVLFVIIAASGLLFWEQYQRIMAMEIIRYDPQLMIYLGGGGNTIVLTSEDGSRALIIDTKMFSGSKKLRESVKAGDTIIVNTHSHWDHTGGNPLFPSAKFIAGAYTREQWDRDSAGVKYPDMVLKPGVEWTIRIGNETVRIRNMGRAHTWNDVVVYCENRKLLVTGDLVFISMHPALSAKSGAHVASWISVLDRLSKMYDIKTLVPGHGVVAGRNGLLAMRDYFVSISDAIDNPEKLAALKEKYKNYSSIPLISGCDETIKYIEKEKKADRSVPVVEKKLMMGH
ncbi:MAG: hypothetical protein A2176_13095 [Spirochaetes bacterium RBG_13_51_14]|nr:MAG: hypothetical protein A2176_13095 [Spirochaetes bacterium RBG_13_51_14]